MQYPFKTIFIIEYEISFKNIIVGVKRNKSKRLVTNYHIQPSLRHFVTLV